MPSLDYVSGQKVKKEIVETLICKKCGCLKIKIKRFAKAPIKINKSNLKILQIVELTGDEALDFLSKTAKIRKRQPQICPVKKVYYSKRVPMSYAKTVSPTEQRMRYVNEQGWAYKSKVLKSEINTSYLF